MDTQDQIIEAVPAEKKPRRQKQETVVSEDQCEANVESSVNLGVYKLSETAVIPEFGTQLAACFDLSADLQPLTNINARCSSGVLSRRTSPEGWVAVHADDRLLIPTGLIFDIPEGYCLEVYPRSGASFKLGISLSNCTGIIDADYTDELFVSVHNISSNSFYIKPGERIAQAKLVKLNNTSINVLSTRPGKKADRKGGFGSTGQ